MTDPYEDGPALPEPPGATDEPERVAPAGQPATEAPSEPRAGSDPAESSVAEPMVRESAVEAEHAVTEAVAEVAVVEPAVAGSAVAEAATTPDLAEPAEVAAVGQAVARLADLAGRPVAEHVSGYDALHGRLQDALAAIEEM